jgi:hypothetical protein
MTVLGVMKTRAAAEVDYRQAELVSWQGRRCVDGDRRRSWSRGRDVGVLMATGGDDGARRSHEVGVD